MRFEIDSYLKIEEINININNELFGNYDNFSTGRANMNLEMSIVNELIDNINIMRKRVDTDEIKEFMTNLDNKKADALADSTNFIVLNFDDINYFTNELETFVKKCKQSLNLR